MSPIFKSCTTLALACALLAPAVCVGGPWVPEPGHGYTKLALRSLPGFGYAPAPTESEPAPMPQPYGAYHEGFLSTYAEVGLAPRLALVASWDLVRTFALRDTRTGETHVHVAPGDFGGGLRVAALRRGRFVSALELWVRVPCAPGAPVQEVYGTGPDNPRIGALRVGSGVWEGEGHLLFGAGFDRFYLSGSLGGALRGGGFDSLLLWTAELGSPLRGGASGRVKLSGRHPLGDGDAPYTESPSGLGNGARVVAFTLELDLPLGDDWALALGLAGGLGPAARQTYGPVFNLGLAATF